MPWTEDYSIWLFYHDSFTTLSPGGQEVYSDDSGLPRCAYLEVRCRNCGEMNLLYADLDDNLSSDERSMGQELLHGLTFNQECGGCREDLEASIDVWEYPSYALSINEMEIQSEFEHKRIHGLSGFAAEVARSTQPPRDMLEELEATRQAMEQMFHGEDTPADVLDVLEQLKALRRTFVVVLGNYHTSAAELEAIKAQLGRRGYTARLVKELPDFEDKSVAQKAFLLMSQAAFCIMLDDAASGHIREYGHAESNEVILARLTPEVGGTTWMIGEHGRPAGHHIKEFRLTGNLADHVDEAMQWAEATRQERADAFTRAYPWMSSTSADRE